jgi:hypothetical protein
VGAENFDFGPRRVINRTSLDLGHLKFQWWRVQNATRVRPFNKAESLVAVCISEGDNWVPLEMRKELRICEY